MKERARQATKWKRENGKPKYFKLAMVSYMAMLLLCRFVSPNYLNVILFVWYSLCLVFALAFIYLFFLVLYDPFIELKEKYNKHY
jgi:hypothetical protein